MYFKRLSDELFFKNAALACSRFVNQEKAKIVATVCEAGHVETFFSISLVSHVGLL
jgi:hypothetical protein